MENQNESKPEEKKPRRPRRRGWGEGTVLKRPNGKWYAQISMGSKGGKRIRISTDDADTKQKAIDNLTLMMAKKATGTLPAPSKVTVRQFLLKWVELLTDVTDSTRESYLEKILIHIIPAIGSVKLQKLTGLELQEMISQLKRKGRAGRNREIDASDRSKQYVYSILAQALKQARKWHLISVNPVEEITRPTVGKFQITPYDENQCLDFLEACQTEPDFCHILMMTPLCGGRQGEMRALRWPDYHISNRSMSIRRTISLNKKGEEYEKETKTRSGARLVELSNIAVDCLEAQRPLALARGSGRDGLVFPGGGGGYLDRFAINRAFHRVREAAKLPRIRFHDLRHTHATILLLLESNPKIIQERLGHANISVTMDIYGHVMPSMQKGAVEKMDAMFEARKRKRENGSKNGSETALDIPPELAIG